MDSTSVLMMERSYLRSLVFIIAMVYFLHVSHADVEHRDFVTLPCHYEEPNRRISTTFIEWKKITVQGVGNTLSLCKADPTPESSVDDCIQTCKGSNRYANTPKGHLIIYDVTEEDAGTYSCSVQFKLTDQYKTQYSLCELVIVPRVHDLNGADGVELNSHRGSEEVTVSLEVNPAQDGTSLANVDLITIPVTERFSELEEKAEKRADELKGLKGVEKELVEANRRIKELEAENMELKKKMDKMESQQDYTNGQLRRNNLIFHGIEQSNNESWEESERKVRDFVSRELDTVVGETIEIERAHRLTKSRNNPQPIIVKFNKYKERERILRESRNLPRESPFKVTKDLPPLVREKRRKLRVFLQAARQDNKRASLRYDKLIIEDDVFVLDQTKEPPQLKKIGNR